MPPKKVKPPAETKAELIKQVVQLLHQKFYAKDKRVAQEFLLNYFTAVDLVGIRNELREYPE